MKTSKDSFCLYFSGLKPSPKISTIFSSILSNNIENLLGLPIPENRAKKILMKKK